jgi:flagellar hook protein FlgE
VTITDPLGASKTLTVNWARVDGTTWTVSASMPSAVGTATLAPITVTMDGWGNISSPTTLTQAVSINWDDATYGAAAADSTVNVNLSNSKPDITLQKISVQIFDDQGNEHVAVLGFEHATFLTAPGAADPPVTGMWYIHPSAGQYATSGATAAAGTLTFDALGNVVSGDSQSFDFSWTSGTPATTTSASVTTDLGTITQLNGSFTLGSISQDGFAKGDMLRSYFTEAGEMKGYFTNGQTRTLFKLPIAQFVSENNLEPVSGNLFKRSQAAGEIAVTFVENAVGEPRFITSSLENSAVDIEEEFTKMIMTQKAYSTNATVFKTADEMTMTARDLKA